MIQKDHGYGERTDTVKCRKTGLEVDWYESPDRLGHKENQNSIDNNKLAAFWLRSQV
jgi:hypothetical protein